MNSRPIVRFFFAVYVDSLLLKLKKSGLGCHIKSFCFNAFMNVNDLILLSISISQLQKLVNLCNTELDHCNLTINSFKSACMPIGPRFKSLSSNIHMNGVKLSWKNEIRYLGIFIISENKFKINFQPVKQKFFKAVNGILGKISSTKNPSVTLSLLNSFCNPILFYGLEALLLNKALRDSLEIL